MKNLNYFKITGLLFVLFFVCLSCSSTKRTAVSCPELPRTNLQKKVALRKTHNTKLFASSNKRGNRPLKITSKVNMNEKQIAENSIQPNNSNSALNHTLSDEITPINSNDSDNLNGSSSLRDLPSTVFTLPNGPRLGTEFNNETNNSNSGYEIKVNKPQLSNSDISLVNNSDETEDLYSSVLNSADQQGTTVQQVEGLGLAGFIVSLAGLLIFGIPFGIIGIVFGAISLSKIKRNPDKYKGKGFAIASLVVGIIDILGVLAVLALL